VSFRTATFADFARRFTWGDEITDFGGEPAFLERGCCGFSRAIARFLLSAFLGNPGLLTRARPVSRFGRYFIDPLIDKRA
jgi:hypothetical protein